MSETCKKGNIAAAKIICDLTDKGYDVFISPISEYLPFDLIAHKNGQLFKIQCKYSSTGMLNSRRDGGSKGPIAYDDSDFDYYAVYLSDVDKVIYPSIKYKGCVIATHLRDSGSGFYWYEDFFDFTSDAQKKTFRDFEYALSGRGGASREKRMKIIWPSAEELQKMLWEKPTIQIAKELGVSDKAVAKWAKYYKLTKPPRGYWSKKENRAGIAQRF